MLAACRGADEAASELDLFEISTSISRRASKRGPPAVIPADGMKNVATDGMENIASRIGLTCIDLPA